MVDSGRRPVRTAAVAPRPGNPVSMAAQPYTTDPQRIFDVLTRASAQYGPPLHASRHSSGHSQLTGSAPAGSILSPFSRCPRINGMNRQLRHWLDAVANGRSRGTTGRIVAERFRDEHSHLLPLPAGRFDAALRMERRSVTRAASASAAITTACRTARGSGSSKWRPLLMLAFARDGLL
jgi:hypothetical protein